MTTFVVISYTFCCWFLTSLVVISEHLAINSKMKVPHRRLYVQNTKNRLERKFERFKHIQNWVTRDNIAKSKKGELILIRAIFRLMQNRRWLFLAKPADGKNFSILEKIKFDRCTQILIFKNQTFSWLKKWKIKC